MRCYFISLFGPRQVTEVYFLDSIYAGLSLARFSFRLGIRKRSRQEEETDSGMLISRCTRLLVVLYWRRRTEETPPGAITFFTSRLENSLLADC